MGLFRIAGIAELEKDIERLEDDLVEVNKTLNSIFERTGRIEEDTDAINSSVGDGLKGTVGDIKAATTKTVESKVVSVLDVADDIDASLGASAGSKLNNLAAELTAVGTNVAAVRSSVGTRLSATAGNILTEVGQINGSVGSGLRALVASVGTNVAAVKTSVGSGLAGTVSQLGAAVSSGLGWLQSAQMILLLDLWRQRPALLGGQFVSGTTISQDIYAMVAARRSDAASLYVFLVWAGSEEALSGSWTTLRSISLGSTHGVDGLRAIVGFTQLSVRRVTMRVVDSTGAVLATTGTANAVSGTLEAHSPHPPVAGRSYSVQMRALSTSSAPLSYVLALIGENPTSSPRLQGDLSWPEFDSRRPRFKLFRRLWTMLRSCAARLLRPWRRAYRIARTWIASIRR